MAEQRWTSGGFVFWDHLQVLSSIKIFYSFHVFENKDWISLKQIIVSHYLYANSCLSKNTACVLPINFHLPQSQ